jgi:hypothetical protein
MRHWAEHLIPGQYDSLYAPQRLQTTTFLADVICLNAILAIESCRRGNSMTIALMFVQFLPTYIIVPRKLTRDRPFVFGLAMQLLGDGQIVPSTSSCNTSPSHPASTPSAPLVSSQPDTPNPPTYLDGQLHHPYSLRPLANILSRHKANLEFRLAILPDLDCPLP